MSSSNNSSSPALFEELEPRLLLSADSLGGLDALLSVDDREFGDTAAQVLPAYQEFSPLQADPATPVSSAAAELRHELVFVDGGIEDYETLVAGFLGAGSEQHRIQVVVLDADRDGIEQITSALAGQTGLDAVHLVSHGDDASLRLGTTTLDGNTLQGYQDAIAGWADALDGDADLLFYGCNLAASEDGRALITALAGLTGADVAASDDLTGAAALGGDWALEFNAGAIETHATPSALAQAQWSGVLATAADESFNYAVGPLGGNGAGAGWTGTWGAPAVGDVNVIGAGLAHPTGGPSPAGGAVELSATDNAPNDATYSARELSTSVGAATETVWASFLLEPAETAAGSYFGIALGDGSSANTSTQMFAGYNGTDFVLENYGASLSHSAPGAATGVTTFLVLKLEIQAGGGIDTATLYVNPTSGLGTPDVAASLIKADMSVDTLSHIALVGGTDEASNAAWIDQLRFGSSFQSVAPSAPVAVDESYSVDQGVTLDTDALSDWQFRTRLTFENSAQSENLDDFPVLIKLDSSRIDYSQTKDNGEDLRFYDSDGVTLLAYEIESWDEAGTSFVWVKVPSVDAASGDDFIYMDYGNAAAPVGQDAASVWSSGYRGVYHLDEAPATNESVTDATGLNHASNSGTTNATGIASDGQDFDGVSQYVDLGRDRDFINNASSTTFSAWINPDTTAGSGDILGVTVDGAPGTGSSRMAIIRDGANVRIIARTMDDGSDTVNAVTTTSPLATGSWHYVAATVDYASNTNNIKIYVDGNLEGTFSHDFTNNAIPNTNSTRAALGTDEDGGAPYFDGQIDEARIATVARSADWIAAQYLSVNDAFVSFGAPRAHGGVLTNDTDRDDDSLSATLISGPSNAQSFVLNADGSFSYTPSAAFSGVDSFTYVAYDGAFQSNVATATITVNTVNDAPVNSLPASMPDVEMGGAALFSSATSTAITVSDTDAAGAAVKVTLTATDGTLTLPSAQGLSFTSGDGIDDAVMVFTGTIADINIALDGMTFFATPGFTGNASVQIVSDDLGNTGPGGAQSDSDTVIISVVPTDPSLWMTFEDDTAATGNPDIASLSGGDVVTFGGTLTFEPGTTSGTFNYAFDLNSLPASDGDTRVNAVHRVSRDTVVGDNAITLLAGDLLLSTENDETIGGTSYKKEDVFVFRPDTPGDYSAGSVFLLVNGEDFGLGKVTAVSLVENQITVGDTTLNRGELLIAHDGAKNDIIRFRPGTLGVITTGTTVRLVDGSDIGIDKKIAALHLVNAPETVGAFNLQAGQLLVALQDDDAAVGDGTPIAITRQDVFVLDVTATGTGTTAATATALFEGLDEVLDENSESIWGLSLQRNPAPIAEGAFSIAENVPAGTFVGTVTATDPEGDTPRFAIVGGNTDGAFVIDGATGALSVLNAAAVDHETNATFALQVAALDDQGSYEVAVVNVTVLNLDEAGINDSPENTVPDNQDIRQDGMVVFSTATANAIAISDFDAGVAPIEITLTATNGTLNLSGTANLGFTVGDGSADTTMTFTGTLTDVNTALEGMTFVATPGFSGTASVQIVTNDLGNTGTGGAKSDTDIVTIEVGDSARALWMTFEDDQGTTGNADIPAVTGGDVVSFGGALELEPGTTTGTFGYQFNLDTIAGTDGNTRVDALHRVSRDMTVGTNAIALQRGDLLLSTDGDETIGGTTFKEEHVFVFRPTSVDDYSSGSFFLLLDGKDLGFGNLAAVTLVERDTVVGDTTLVAGEFLVAHDGATGDLQRVTPGTLGDTTTGTVSRFIDGGDVGIGQKIAGIHLVQNASSLGDLPLTDGQILLSLQGDDSTVGDAPGTIAVTRQDIVLLDVTVTGSDSAATATPLFEGADVALDTNQESIWGVTTEGDAPPVIDDATFAVAENVATATVVGSVTAIDPEGDAPRYAILAGNVDGAFAIDAVSGQITVANAATMDHETNPEFTLTVAAMDSTGGYDTATVRIEIVNLDEAGINDSPVNTVPGTQAIAEEGMLVFAGSVGTGVSISDFDAATSPVQVTLTATDGTVTLPSTLGLSFTVGDGSDDVVMTFTGTVADINAALDGMTFIAAADFTGSASLQITANDLGNTGTGGAKSDTDTVTIQVGDTSQSLWMTFENDVAVTGNDAIPAVTGGDVVTFGGLLSFEPGTTEGSFNYQFNLDSIAGTDGNTRVNALHRVSRDMTVGSNAIALQRGDLLLSTNENEIIGGITYESRDVFVFRPTSVNDYSAGSVFMLIDGSDVGLGKLTAISLVETNTTVGVTPLAAGEFLLAHDGAANDLIRFQPGSLGDTTTAAVALSALVAGVDIDIDQKFAGIHLIQSDTTLGELQLQAGQLLVSLQDDDPIVGDGPSTIDVKRQDIFVLDVTATGAGTSAATATRLFEGLDQALDTSQESIWGIALENNATPGADDASFNLDENSAAATVVGTVTATDPEGDTPTFAIVAGNTGGAFTIDAASGQITVANSAALDFETMPVFTLTVAAMDSEGAYDTASVTVNLNDINEFNVSTTGNTVLFTEDAGATTALFAAAMDTVETGDTVSQVVLTLANVESGDTLLFGPTTVDLNTNAATGPDANGFTYTVSSAGATPVVTISHAGATDTLTNTMLNALVFNNTSNDDPGTTARTVTLTSATESGAGLTADGTVATVNVAKADDPLVVSTTGNTVLFTEDAGATSSLFTAGMDTVESGDTVSQVILTLANVEAGDTLLFGATSVDLNTNGASGPDANGFTYTVSSAGASPVVTISHAGATDTLTNTMLNSLVFNNTANNDPSTTARTVTLTSVTDSGSGLTNDGTVATVNVAKADDPLVVSTTGNTVLFTEDAGATTALFAATMDTVETGDTVTQVVLTLANVEAGDTLVFGATSVDLNTDAASGPDANGFTYTVSSAGVTPVVTITHAGTDDATVNTMLNSLVFNNASNDDPSTTARTVTLTSVTDSGTGTTADGTVATVNVAKADDPLLVSTTGNTVLFTEDAGATTALFAATMDTVETGDTVSQVILTLANVESGDTLLFGATSVDLNTNAASGPDANGFTYTVSSAGATPVVTISHAGTDDATVNTMLNSLVFNNASNDDPSTTARTVTLTSVTDSGSGTTNDGTVATVNVAKADDPLLVSTTGNTVLFTEDAGATTALFTATMDTVETGDTVSQVVLTLANVEAGDTLMFGATSVDLNTNAATGPDANGFTYTVSSAGSTPVVTISHAGASDTLTNTMLNSLVFNNTSNDDPSTTARTVTLTSVTDSGSGLTNDGTMATVNVAKTDDPLLVSTTGNTVLFTEDAGATTALFTATMDTVETGDTVTQLVLTLANVESGDTLLFGATSVDLNTNAASGPDANGFTYTVSSAGATPVVTISHAGTDDATVNTMLNSLVFNNTSNDDPSTTARTVTLTSVTDSGSGLTNDGTVATVNVAKADDPLLVSTTGNTVLFTEDAGATTALFAATMDTVETGDTVTQLVLTLANVESGDTLLFGATSVDLNTNAASGPDANGFTYTVSSAGATPVVTISHAGTDDATVNTMLNSLVFNNTANNDPGTTARTVTLTSVTDSGSGTTNDGTVATVNVAKADDPLLVSTTGNTVLFTEDASATTALFAATMDTVETGDTVTQLVLTLANVESGDTLLFGATSVDLNTNAASGPDANGFTYTVSSAGVTPVVTITHAGTDDATVNTMLNSLVFNNTSNDDPSTTARTVTLTSVTDSGSGLTNDGTVATVNVAKADDPLLVSTTGNTVLFTEDAGATTALFAATMDTVETGDTVSQVILTLANVESGDTLLFGATSVDLNTNAASGPDANGFTYTVSSAGATPVVTISHAGTDDATVNTMLNSLVFNNTANNDPGTTARTVTLTSVTDSGSGTTNDGTVATVNVAKADDPLLVSTTGNTVLFTEDAGATTALFAATMDTVETGDTVTQLVLTLANVESGDTLLFGATSVDLNTNAASGPDANGFTYTVSSAGVTPVVTITHAGTDDATVNTMLNSLVFNNASNDDPSTTARTVTLTSVTDSGTGTTADGTVATVNVAKADDPLVVSTTGTTVLFTEDAGATSSLFTAGMDTVETGDTVTQLVLTLANVESGDTLLFGATSVDLNTNAATGPDANGFTYTVSSAGSTPVVTISHAGASDTLTNTMLNSLVFNNTSNDDPSTTARTVTLTSVTDSGSGLTNDGTIATVNVAKADDPLVVSTTGNTVLFTEDAGATTALFTATMDTVETGDTVTQLVLTLANVESGDTLLFGATSVDLNTNAASGPDANGFTYTVSSAGATPVVTISHAGTDDATVNTMLNSLVFNNTSNDDPSTTARTVTLTSVTDSGTGTTADGTVATVNVSKADDPLLVSTTGNTVLFTEDAGATTALFAAAMDTVEAGDTVSQVILTLANVEAGDTLTFGATPVDLNTDAASGPDANGFTYTVSSAGSTPVVTISHAGASDTLTNTMLNSLVFNNISNDDPSTTARTVTLTSVTDSGSGLTNDGTVATVNVAKTNDAPTVSLINVVASLPETTSTVTAIKIADIVVTDVDAGTNNLTLAGDDLAHFEIVGTELRLKAGTSLDYEIPADAGTNHIFDVTVVVDDPGAGGTPDDTAATTLTVTDVNENPGGAGTLTTTSLNDNAGATNLFGGLTVSDPDTGENDLSVTITLTNPAAGVIGGGFTDLGGGVFRATGLTVVQADSALDNATFTPTDGTGPSGTFTTDITLTVNDQGGGGEQSVLSATAVTITRVNTAPSGLPIIFGAPVETLVLTATTDDISDADGLGAFSFQWFRDGVPIGAATDSSYTLVGEDRGTNIAVRVEFIDGNGATERVTSVAVGPVSDKPEPDIDAEPEGLPPAADTPEEVDTAPPLDEVELSAVLPLNEDLVIAGDPESTQATPMGESLTIEPQFLNQITQLLDAAAVDSASSTVVGYRPAPLAGVQFLLRDRVFEPTATEMRPIPDSSYHSSARQALIAGVQDMQTTMTASGDSQIAAEELRQTVIQGTLGTLSVGSVTWLLRAGSLLASVFSSIPMWSTMDPLPVLNVSSEERKRRLRASAEVGSDDASERRMDEILDGADSRSNSRGKGS